MIRNSIRKNIGEKEKTGQDNINICPWGRENMTEGLQKKYGLGTSTAMVVGIVIGSGVFFKAEKVLQATGGNLPLGILSWIIGGMIMIVCAYTFAVMASRYERVGGIVDYAEATLGKTYAYYVGWFLAAIYYPTLTGALAWVSARYACILLGFSITGPEAMTIAAFFLVASYSLNALSPLLAGKYQVTTTVIKLIPLLLMAVIGTVAGLANGTTAANFTMVVNEVGSPGKAVFTAVVATAFAYEGWIIATSINAEIKDAKKNLPRALVLGTFIIMAVYVLYYVGLAGSVPNSVIMESGEKGARIAFENIFGRLGGTALFVFVVISCLGTLNGLMLGCTRGMYALAARGEGPRPDIFSQLDRVTNMAGNSSIIGLFFCSCWFLQFYSSQLTETPWIQALNFDMTELPIVTIYAAYIPIFIMMMKKEKGLPAFKRFVVPALALCGCVFMILAAVFSHGFAVVRYMCVFVIIMLIGCWIKRGKTRSEKE